MQRSVNGPQGRKRERDWLSQLIVGQESSYSLQERSNQNIPEQFERIFTETLAWNYVTVQVLTLSGCVCLFLKSRAV